MADFILQTIDLTKDFKGFTAVRRVNLNVERGQIHALIGPNGAGKTTCFNLLTKFLSPTAGQIVFNGTRHYRIEAGASRAPGHHPLVPDFRGVSTHDLAGKRPHRAAAQARQLLSFLAERKSLSRLNDRAMDLLEQVGLADFAESVTVDLPYGRKRALEIAVTLARDPELMLLDEPTSGMGHEDVDRVTALIKKVSQGRTILMVEHNMNLVAGICRPHHRAAARRGARRRHLRRGVEGSAGDGGVYGDRGILMTH